MAQLTYAQLEGLWMQTAAGTRYGTRPWAALMAAIAEAESGGNPDATNPGDNGGRQTSWGLWQISLGNHQPPAAAWADPATNAQLALGKLQSQGLGAWGTYTSGAYRAYLSSSTTPDGSVPANPAALTAETAAAQHSDCLYGFGGIPGTSWITDLTGSGGNLGQMCVITRSEARGLAGAVLLAGGAGIMALGVGYALVGAGLQTRAGQAVIGAATGYVTRRIPPPAPPPGRARPAPGRARPAPGQGQGQAGP